MLAILRDVFHLIYPSLCIGCQEEAIANSQLFCASCEAILPMADFHLIEDNEAMLRMVGGPNYVFGASMFRFYPDGMMQDIIHRIKYKGQTDIAFKLGRRYGEQLLNLTKLQDLHCIIPVPLHRKKQQIRGYNQSTYFADGLSQSLHVFTCTNSLRRTTNTSTQTSKSRSERLKTMLGAFELSKASKDIQNKHVMVVDDVLTTGSTLHACNMLLSSIPGIRISFATIALAQ